MTPSHTGAAQQQDTGHQGSANRAAATSSVTKRSTAEQLGKEPLRTEQSAAKHAAERALLLHAAGRMGRKGVPENYATGENVAATRVQAVLGLDIDWAWLTGQARKHDIEPFLYAYLRDVPKNKVPSVVRDRLKRRSGLLAVTNMHRARELLRVVGRLEAARLPALSFKGPVLGALSYGDMTLRPAVDLDVLISPEHFHAALKVLYDSGYESVTCPEPPPRSSERHAAFAAWNRSCELYHSEKQVYVELHYAFFPQGVPDVLSPEAVWARHVKTSFLGRSIRTLAPEDHLLYVCAHGTWHRWAKLKWIADVAGLLARISDLDFGVIRTQAEHSGALRRVRLGVGLAHQLLGASVPPGWRRDIVGDPAVSKMVQTVRNAWLFTYRTTDADPWVALRFQLRARERWRDRWAFLRRELPHLVGPSDQDRAAVPLPSVLEWLYLVVRPFRVLWDRFTGSPGTRPS